MEKFSDILPGPNKKEIEDRLKDLTLNELLLKSSKNGYLIGVQNALKMGADVHTDDDLSLCYASLGGNIDIAKLLLKHGADVSINDDYPIRYASFNGHYDMVKFLLKHGANPRGFNNSVVLYAEQNNHYDIVKLLKEYMKNGEI